MNPNDPALTRRHVLITGASGGIGQALAERFAAGGYALTLVAHHHGEYIEALSAKLRSKYGTPCRNLTADLSDPAEVDRVFEELSRTPAMVSRAFDMPEELDLLINNAGISRVSLAQDMAPEEYASLIAANLSSAFYCCRKAIPRFLGQGYGRILNISSVWGESGASCEAVYAASKGGMNALTKSLGKELAPSGIPVNALACGAIDTAMNDHLSPEEKAALSEEIPAGRFGRPEEVAEMAYLLAQAPAYLTAQIITFDGGWT